MQWHAIGRAGLNNLIKIYEGLKIMRMKTRNYTEVSLYFRQNIIISETLEDIFSIDDMWCLNKNVASGY